ncbi:hypothetical protein AB0G60_12975 [Streptomyces angustmyceticus]|uniref:Gram-positive cocci surface proteins LPxTG domain-containing protein n=1 Tax=Streptomyces angustmyceticus TaxID=285578 RepID=A0A5J4LAD4_9ACTN|nr:hypothetical protein [Streptomyces angustmyceticus]UAL67429.1 hypothetical protein K7396_13490 [Streptomyces angustmyceticus]GES31163.1 hypothetical protein San01_36500 [Streptomyces angustmyceticus]
MTARRPLLTAAAAGSVLFALWFVPSANASAGADGVTDSGLRAASAAAGPGLADRVNGGAQETGSGSTTTAPQHRATGPGSGSGTATGTESRSAVARPHLLADTGSPDTTPYVIGGVACLALGAGLVSYSVGRTRDGLL